MPDTKYKAFISYSHSDEKWADWLHKAIETYRIPKRLVGQAAADGPIPKRLSPVFRDREELSTASDLGRVVNAAIGSAGSSVRLPSTPSLNRNDSGKHSSRPRSG